MTILEKLRAGVTTGSAEETRTLAAEFAAALPPDVVVALNGNLGVGKTTFVQGLARGLGMTEPVTSPTFTIYTVHHTPVAHGALAKKITTLVHLDAYRLENSRQVEDLLVEDFLETPWCLAVEWPEKIAEWLPPQSLQLVLGITGDERHTIQLLDRGSVAT